MPLAPLALPAHQGTCWAPRVLVSSALHPAPLAQHQPLTATPAPTPPSLLHPEYAPRAHAIPHLMSILTAKLHLVYPAVPSSPVAPFAVSTFQLPQFAYHVSLEIILTEVSYFAFLVEMAARIAITEVHVDHATLG